ncbi:hypothetical protein LCGC14_0893430 [marine sediment metagenome]|uniref:Uncharacterized protein n=1 Tax=marine sediment metagenome TaxID=412755 RepID=A0A0F9P3D1_9ZZZZ
MNVSIEWIEEESAYTVRQNGEFIGDYENLQPAAEFALAVAANAGVDVVLISVNQNA